MKLGRENDWLGVKWFWKFVVGILDIAGFEKLLRGIEFQFGLEMPFCIRAAELFGVKFCGRLQPGLRLVFGECVQFGADNDCECCALPFGVVVCMRGKLLFGVDVW